MDVQNTTKRLCDAWNSWSSDHRMDERQIPAKSVTELIGLEMVISRLTYDFASMVDVIIEAINNRWTALVLPNSRCNRMTLGQFLRWENLERYLPGTFNLDCFREDALKTSNEQIEEIKDLKAKGIL